MLPEGKAGADLSEGVEVRIEDGDRGDEAEREEGKAGQDAQGAGRPAQLGLGVMGIRDCRLNGGEPPAAPCALVRSLAGPAVSFAQRLAQGGTLDTAIFTGPP